MRQPYCGERFRNCSISHLGDPLQDLQDEWKPLPEPEPKCRSGGSFVSFLSGDIFVPAAICLLRQLRRVNSACPVSLVVDAANVSPNNTRRVVREFGQGSVLRLDTLQTSPAALAAVARASKVPLGGRGKKVAGRLTNISLSSSSKWEIKALHKLWLFALPDSLFPLACFLDLDVLVLANIDGLLSERTLGAGGGLAAVPALGCRHGANVFNSAVFVFRPSISTFESLLRRERTYDRVGQACENAFTDQSLLNAQFRGGCPAYNHPTPCRNLEWRRLPLNYNVNIQMWSSVPGAHWEGIKVAVIHFAGAYAKPWNQMPLSSSKSTRYQSLERERVMRYRWRRDCSTSMHE